MVSRIAFLGGNGHSSVRLDAARQAIARLGDPFELIDVPYPGFEGRPRVDLWERFVDSVAEGLKQSQPRLVYSTGISGLVALALRARGDIVETPIIMQGPVLWGLARRWFPWFMRRGLWRLLPLILREPKFQRRFAQTKFTRPPSPEFIAAFFNGYRQCPALTDFFHWLTPSLLRQLEADFVDRPERLERITCWWGDRDAVVSIDELRVTERALKVQWPVRTFPAWGHYPMIDEPEEWVRELSHALATLA